jgi:hypothetical protein
LVFGGLSNGTEMWDPSTDLVQTISDFPPEIDNSATSVANTNDAGTDVIFYQPYSKKSPTVYLNTSIWNFNLATRTWTQLGQLLLPRNDFSAVALPCNITDPCK